MRRFFLLLITSALMGYMALTQAITPKQALERLFTERPAREEWFSPQFLTQVPAAAVDRIIADLEAQLGTYRGVRPEGREFAVVFDRGEVPTYIALDEKGRIVGLFFRPPRKRLASLDEALAALRELPGEVSLLVREGDRELVSLSPDEPMAVASAFKLAVLVALKREIDAGRLGWDSVVELKPEWKSLPTGILQDWPDGSPMTIHTLAALMISRSDNTAADALIHILGREKLEAIAPRNRPFPTTREAFFLKAPGNEAWRARYLAADVEGKREILAEIAELPLPPGTAFPLEPQALEIEWFFTVRELCDLMAQVEELSLMGINPGLALPERWARVAYKGGSEPGVLNLTTAVASREGGCYCVSVTWNDPQSPLDEARLYAIYGGILWLLGER